MAKTNPFFDVDVSKFTDVSKLMSEFKLPGVDVEERVSLCHVPSP